MIWIGRFGKSTAKKTIGRVDYLNKVDLNH